ncbi:sulfur carrier protein ThiS [Nitratifractor salsuginis]|uniref:Sulfur carrier protein ThiS n=1 Tax=Nitratifractor salsuginis (strain DSM 16511 / JCM 12458 / E9I37-1) TaxID=749222 RepID=E6X0U0_NITSE|nr:sulfur carrier protein ThiS [Nitratifractor salsuginis]ADV46872.1 sulfur carrier protein ThiS [Nitratifractor salsuginis DSM 16511]
MTVTVNGERREIESGTTLEALIKELGIGKKVMAAAVNMEIVKKDRWPRHRLQEDDRVELLHFVGGG